MRPGELSTEEKAAEVGKDGMSFFRKNAVYIVPTALLVVNSILVVNNATYRYFSEKYLPTYVGYLRTTVGFRDEDLPEMERLKSILENESHAETLVVHVENGMKIEVNDVIGSRLIGDVMSEAGGSVVNITFADSSSDRAAIESSSSASNSGNVVIKSVVAKSEWDDWQGAGRGQGRTVKGMVLVQDPAYSYNQSSLLNTKYARHSSDFAYLDILVNNIGAYTSWTLKLPKSAKLQSSSSNSIQQRQQEISRQKDDSTIKEIGALQRKIAQLKMDVANPYSTRHIDDVEDEIKRSSTELAKLQRKRNWSYFF